MSGKSICVETSFTYHVEDIIVASTQFARVVTDVVDSNHHSLHPIARHTQDQREREREREREKSQSSVERNRETDW
jgi:hypothetical protein